MQHRLVLPLLPCAQAGHHLIDAACAQAAAEGKHHGAVACTKLGTDGISLLCLCEHLRAHRVAHHDGLIGCSQLFHSGRHSGEHDVHIRCQQLIGHARKGVLFMDSGMNAHFCSTAHHRAGYIAAAADHEIGPDFPHDLLCLGAGKGQIPQGDDVAPDVVQRQSALETGDLDVVERIARLTHQTVLHALPAAGKVDLGRRI